MHSFLRVAVEYDRVRPSVNHERQFPGHIVAVLQACIDAANAEDGQQVRSVAGQQNAAMAIIIQGKRICGIDCGPIQLPRDRMADHAQHGIDAPMQELRLQGPLVRLAIRQAKINAPYAVRLAMNQHIVAGVPSRIEKAQPLGRKIDVGLDVGDNELTGVGASFHAKLHQPANRGTSPIRRHYPVGGQGIFALGGVHRESCPCVILRYAHHSLSPADIDQRGRIAVRDQVFLDVLLLNIEAGQVPIVGIMRHQHGVDLPTAKE